MTDIRELLPIGSVVVLKNGVKRLMIFGVCQTNNEDKKDYDYIGVIYPEGNIGQDGQFLFNHEDIEQIFYRGYEDEERDGFVERLEQFYGRKE